MNWRAPLLARREVMPVVASAALFLLAFPPVPLVVPAFVCLAPLAVLVARGADAPASWRWRDAARVGLWTGVLAYGVTLYWIAIALFIYTWIAPLGLVGALLVVAPVVAAGTVALFLARRATGLPLALLLPVTWLAVEMALMHLSDLAFPWLPLGLAVARTPVLAQAAELSGVHGLSCWIAATNGLFADAWLDRARWRPVAARLAGAVALAGAVWAFGSWRMQDVRLTPVAPITIVQPNVPQLEKWQAENRARILGMLLAHTAEAPPETRLVVWPEAALPGFLPEHPEWERAVTAVTARTRTPILFGVLDLDFPAPGQFEYFNAAMLADSAGSIRGQPPYHKRYLVPVVERVPFLDPRWFSKLRFFGGFGRGGEQPPFTLPFGKVGVLICYESIFPEESRRYRLAGATVIVNITNDAWFGRSLAPYQHEAHLALRAIENRTGVVRAANTGISAYFDPLGREHGATELFTPATRTYLAETSDAGTLYLLIGDWIGWLGVAGTALLLAVAYRRRRSVA